MEFNARYILISILGLLTLIAGFAFVFWLNNSGGFGPKDQYQVRFTVPVGGLGQGSNVLFNGLKVGEVTSMSLDPDEPSNLVANINVAQGTPVREDTNVSVDFQGLTGAANILLTGGVATSPALKKTASEVPVLYALPANSISWTQGAAKVLGRLDNLFNDNKGRFDAILAGLERMTGGTSEAAAPIYDLQLPAPTSTGDNIVKPEWQLVISEPSVVLSLNTSKVLQQETPGAWTAIKDAQWSDNLPNLFQAKFIQAFENAGYKDAVLRPADALDPTYRLILDIRAFHYRSYDNPAAVIDLVVKILDQDGKVLSSQQIALEEPVAENEKADIIAGLNKAFVSASAEILKATEKIIETASGN